MASLSMARPGKVSERQYLGDLAGLFERQRRRTGVALTPDSFAADLAANDALRSGLFTLCNAISHMGEHDLSPDELLDLVARALCGAASAEGETGTHIPADMRDAFLSGYSAWQNRDTQPITAFDPEDWPPVAPAARKPPARETATDAVASQKEIAANGGISGPAISSTGRRTVQEAIGLARRQRPEFPDTPSSLPAGPDTGSMTLGELKHFLEDIEHRVSRLGPHLQQLKSAGLQPARYDRERPALLTGGVIPFPDRRGKAIGEFDEEWLSPVKPDPIAPRRSAPALHDDPLSASAAPTDNRPPGIDALLAAASAWANSLPTARSFDEDAFLSRHAYLAPSRRPGATAPASLYYAETPAQPLAPPPAALQEVPVAAIVKNPAPLAAPAPVIAAPSLIGLDAEEDPLLSPLERLHAYLLRLPPRKVFLALASLTIFAGCLAGFMAYRTLHGHAPQFKDLEPTVRFGAAGDSPPVSIATVAPIAQTLPAAQSVATVTPAPAPLAKPAAPAPAIAAHPRPHLTPAHTPVAVWPPVPQTITRDSAPTPVAVTTSSAAATPQASSSAVLFVPAPTMIGYALATPQPSPRPHSVIGTVAVDITVSRLGDVTSAHAVSGPPELYPAAVAAVRGWRFRPYLIDGKPALVSTTLQFFFKGE
jgi:TonB-like protein